MQPIAVSCPKSLQLLRMFVSETNGGQQIVLQMIDGSQVPSPFHEMLVHQRDMTSTLTNHHQQQIRLDVIEQRAVPGEMFRHVVLCGKRNDRPVEYGVIRIRLDALADWMKEDVLKGEEPLGGLLNAAAMHYRSCPGGFLRVRPHPEIVSALQIQTDAIPEWLFGRCNCLTDDNEIPFAEVVEILPPIAYHKGSQE